MVTISTKIHSNLFQIINFGLEYYKNRYNHDNFDSLFIIIHISIES